MLAPWPMVLAVASQNRGGRSHSAGMTHRPDRQTNIVAEVGHAGIAFGQRFTNEQVAFFGAKHSFLAAPVVGAAAPGALLTRN